MWRNLFTTIIAFVVRLAITIMKWHATNVFFLLCISYVDFLFYVLLYINRLCRGDIKIRCVGRDIDGLYWDYDINGLGAQFIYNCKFICCTKVEEGEEKDIVSNPLLVLRFCTWSRLRLVCYRRYSKPRTDIPN